MLRKEAIDEYFEVGGELGRGKFAVVRKCREKSSGEAYAAKYLRKRRRGCDCREDIIKEIDIMRAGKDQQRIIQIKEVFESQREMIIILELAEGGELFRRITDEPLSEQSTRRVVRQVLEGVAYLHDREIVHMDLKPENILICEKGGLDIKVADFGLAVQLHPGQILCNLVGTAEYVAPEILNYEPISCASDMWSIGALTYALMTGYSPFQGETTQETFLNVSMVDYSFEEEVFDSVSEHVKDFISKLLVKKPRDRISAKDCLSHPWMTAQDLSRPLHSHYESSTSVDSSISLSMDNVLSSCETSPLSSTASSFAAGGRGCYEATVTDEEKGSECDQPMVYSSEVFNASLQVELHKKLGQQVSESSTSTEDGASYSMSSTVSPEPTKERQNSGSTSDNSKGVDSLKTSHSGPGRPDKEGTSPSLLVPSTSESTDSEGSSCSQNTLTRHSNKDDHLHQTKKISPELTEKDNILQLLKNGMSLIDGSESTDWGNSPRTVSRTHSDVPGGQSCTNTSREIPKSNHPPTTEPTVVCDNNMPGKMEDFMKLLTEGVSLSFNTSNNSDHTPLEHSPSPKLRKGTSNEQKKPVVRRPDSFILPVEVQEAILKGDVEPVTIWEEPTNTISNGQ